MDSHRYILHKDSQERSCQDWGSGGLATLCWPCDLIKTVPSLVSMKGALDRSAFLSFSSLTYDVLVYTYVVFWTFAKPRARF